MADRNSMKVGGRYNWRNQPERLVYIGLCEPRNGRWHQFEKVGEPGKVWCEVLDFDLRMIEETPSTGRTLLDEFLTEAERAGVTHLACRTDGSKHD